MVALSGFNRYDALVNVTPQAFENSGKLGVVMTTGTPASNAVLEFKFTFDDLITDFVNKVKNANEIDYVVCWDCPSLNLAVGTLRPVYGDDWKHGRPARAVSYVWTDPSTSVSFNVIALRNVVAELLAADDNPTGRAHLDVVQVRDRESTV
jgi:hypothetical protein